MYCEFKDSEVIIIIIIIIIIIVIIIIIIVIVTFNRINISVIESAINVGLVSKFRSNWNLKVLAFMEGGKQENPEKNPRSNARTNNTLNPHEMLSTGIEPGSQRREASAYPLCQPCSRNTTFSEPREAL